MTGRPSRIRVLVADDSVVRRQAVASVLAGEPELSVVATVGDRRAVHANLLQQPIDVIVLDAAIPRREGPTMLSELRELRPHTKVIVVEDGGDKRGAAVGADDVVELPSAGDQLRGALTQARATLVPRIKALASLRIPPAPRAGRATGGGGPGPRLVAIGASTGGPEALTSLLRALPTGFATPIAIAQHMPAGFTRMLADRLSQAVGRRVVEVSHDLALGRCVVAMAPGDLHLAVGMGPTGELRARPSHAPPENQVRPAVDVLFRTAAAAVGSGLLAVVLTGMGKDGTAGASLVRDAGGKVLAQDEASSVVWGMPGSVVRAGLAHDVCSIPELAAALVAFDRGAVLARAGEP